MFYSYCMVIVLKLKSFSVLNLMQPNVLEKKNGMKGVLSFFIRPFSHAEIKKNPKQWKPNKNQTKENKTTQRGSIYIYWLNKWLFFLKHKPLKSLEFLRCLKSVLIQEKGEKRLLWSFLWYMNLADTTCKMFLSVILKTTVFLCDLGELNSVFVVANCAQYPVEWNP